MAEKTLKTRLKLRFDTLTNWQNESVEDNGANLKLLKGEVAVCEVPATEEGGKADYLLKVGDGENIYKDLEYVSGKAADVYPWAKQEDPEIYRYDIAVELDTETNNPIFKLYKTNIVTSETTVEEAIDLSDYFLADIESASSAIVIDKTTANKPTISLKTSEDIGTVTLEQVTEEGKKGLKASVNIKDDDKVLGVFTPTEEAEDKAPKLYTEIALSYDQDPTKPNYIQLTGLDGQIISEFDATEFITHGIVYGATSFVAEATSQEITIKEQKHTFTDLTVGTQYLVLCFTDGDPVSPQFDWIKIDLSEIIEIYTSGDGIEIDNNVIKVKFAQFFSGLKIDENNNGLAVNADLNRGLDIDSNGVGIVLSNTSSGLKFMENAGGDNGRLQINLAENSGLKIGEYGKTDQNQLGIDTSITFIMDGGSSIIPAVPIPWATGTDEEIVAAIRAARAGAMDLQEDCGWKVGDVRTITIEPFTDGSGTYHAQQTIDIAISQFGDYMNCGCVMQFDFKDELATAVRMNSSATTEGGWGQCEMKTTTMPALVNALPAWLKGLLIEFSCLASAGSGSSTIDTVTGNKLALRSEVEIFGNTIHSKVGEGSQIEYYKTTENRIKKRGHSGSVNEWWERSPSGGDTNFCEVNSDGSASNFGPNIAIGVAPFGCI